MIQNLLIKSAVIFPEKKKTKINIKQSSSKEFRTDGGTWDCRNPSCNQWS